MGRLLNSIIRPNISERLRNAKRGVEVARRLNTWTDVDQAWMTFYQRFVGPTDIVFDVGANVGMRTKIFRRIASKTIAVEPQSWCAGVLRHAFGDDARVTVEPYALGNEPGEAEIQINSAHMISSMSEQWMQSVEASGRFAGHRWQRRETVTVSTLESLIEKHGEPSFIKVDVEGFEPMVLQGLDRPIAALSFEYTPEHSESTFQCMEILGRLGRYEYNLGLGEVAELRSADWYPAEDFVAALPELCSSEREFGDVYARHVDRVVA
jgi:FkbM family methyltransferase